MKIKFILVFFLLSMFPGGIYAASNVNIGLANLDFITSQTDISITLSPTDPTPYTQVEASLKRSSGTASVSEIAWLINNEIITSGKGKDKFIFNTQGVGQVIELSAVIQRPGMPLLVTRKLINPSRVTLLKEAETYTPPFYKGRALHSAGSFIRLSAVAEVAKNDGSLYAPDELTYIWSKNGTSLRELSGVGKATIRLKGPGFLGSDLFLVSVLDTSGIKRAQMATIVESKSPKIILYEKKPLMGTEYFKAITNTSTISGPDIRLTAEPYFIDSNNKNSNVLKYLWKIGKKVLPIQEPQSELTFNTDKSGKNKTLEITVSVNHLKNLIQSTKAIFVIKLGDSLSNFIF